MDESIRYDPWWKKTTIVLFLLQQYHLIKCTRDKNTWFYQYSCLTLPIRPNLFLDEERFIMQQLRVVIIYGVWISILSRALKRVKVLAQKKSPLLKVSFSSLVPSCPRCKILSINPTHRTHRLWILAIEVFNTLELTMRRQYCPL